MGSLITPIGPLQNGTWEEKEAKYGTKLALALAIYVATLCIISLDNKGNANIPGTQLHGIRAGYGGINAREKLGQW